VRGTGRVTGVLLPVEDGATATIVESRGVWFALLLLPPNIERHHRLYHGGVAAASAVAVAVVDAALVDAACECGAGVGLVDAAVAAGKTGDVAAGPAGAATAAGAADGAARGGAGTTSGARELEGGMTS
jgi:hypothetical protein